MSQQEKLTDEEVHYIIGAFDVASGETDADYSELKNKLFRMHPTVKAEVDDYAVRLQRASDEQDSRRYTITQFMFDDLDLTKPVLEQIKNWIKSDSNWEILRGAYSDEICLPGDLWRYHLEDLKKAGLIDEIKEVLRIESEQKGNEWMKRKLEREDKEVWHDLVRILETVRR